jgi:hypothetical protein
MQNKSQEVQKQRTHLFIGQKAILLLSIIFFVFESITVSYPGYHISRLRGVGLVLGVLLAIGGLFRGTLKWRDGSVGERITTVAFALLLLLAVALFLPCF